MSAAETNGICPIEPSRLTGDPAFSLGTRIYDELADRTLPTDQDSVWKVIEQNNHQLANERHASSPHPM